MLETIASQYPEREAIVFGDERITFAQFRARAERFAGGLSALGLGSGDKVGIWLPNRALWFIAQYACAKIGAVVVALNPRYKAHELSYILAQSDARALLLTDHFGPVDYFETLHDVVPALPHAVAGEAVSDQLPMLRHVIVDADDPYPGCHRLIDVVEAGHRDGQRAPRESGQGEDSARVRSGWDADSGRVGFRATESASHPDPVPDDLFTLLYTSGTTSFPKGAMITHHNCVPHAWNCGEVLRLTPDDRILHALPAAGTWGGVNIPLTTWSHAACLVLMDAYDPLRALFLIERERCTVWNAVDTMVTPMLEHGDLDRYDRSSLRTGGFAATGGGGHGLFDAVVKRIGIPHAFQPYGMTEVNAMALVHDLDEPLELRALPGIRPLPGLEVRVIHPDTGLACKPDEEGEFQFRGALVTRGYYKKPEETKAAFTDDGWFRSGDLGVQDPERRTIFKGRLRETLRISHFMVAPGEIEAFLMSHPAVVQAFVVGIPDPKTNEAPVAYVIAKDDARLTEEALQSFCRGKIASYKIPRVIRFVQDVPRTPSPHGDKVQRVKLREMALKEFAR